MQKKNLFIFLPQFVTLNVLFSKKDAEISELINTLVKFETFISKIRNLRFAKDKNREDFYYIINVSKGNGNDYDAYNFNFEFEFSKKDNVIGKVRILGGNRGYESRNREFRYEGKLGELVIALRDIIKEESDRSYRNSSIITIKDEETEKKPVKLTLKDKIKTVLNGNSHDSDDRFDDYAYPPPWVIERFYGRRR